MPVSLTVDDTFRRRPVLRPVEAVDSGSEDRFGRITRLAQRIFSASTAVVSLLDADRQWATTAGGGELRSLHPDLPGYLRDLLLTDVVVVADTTVDRRFADSPMRAASPPLRFYAGCPIAGPDGSTIGTLSVLDPGSRTLDGEEIGLLRDLAETVGHEIAVRSLSVDDELTGLRNRRGFTLLARQAMAMCDRQEVDGLLVFADVNGLKHVNDEYGHLTGDRLLQGAAGAMARALRTSDVVARLGGDEFAGFLTVFSGDPAVIEGRLAEAAEAAAADMGDLPAGISLAVGSTLYDHRRPRTLEDLMRRADAAMYANKLRMKATALP